MRAASLRRFLTIIAVSLALVGAPQAFAQEDPEDPEDPIQSMPKDRYVSPSSLKGASPPKVKTAPSVKATPIEIPGKGQPVVKEKPSVQATPIEIPGKGQSAVKKKPSVEVIPIPIPKPGADATPVPRP
jgi:hypothetical protein